MFRICSVVVHPLAERMTGFRETGKERDSMAKVFHARYAEIVRVAERDQNELRTEAGMRFREGKERLRFDLV